MNTVLLWGMSKGRDQSSSGMLIVDEASIVAIRPDESMMTRFPGTFFSKQIAKISNPVWRRAGCFSREVTEWAWKTRDSIM